MPADIMLIGAPLSGVFANFLSLIILRRLSANSSLLNAIVAAFGIGGVLSASLALWVLIGERSSVLEVGSLFLCIMIVYIASGIIIFALINLGETSLRIRMLGKLIDSPLGVSRNELVADYDDRALLDIRLRRLREKGQAKFVDGAYYSRRSLLFFAASAIRLLKAILYGNRKI
jgi:hypothetical protein